ncbi:MAG: hypothetical protein U0Q16_28175 [Bryobacteraceae bacterium]
MIKIGQHSIAFGIAALAGVALLGFGGKWAGGQIALAQLSTPLPSTPRLIQFVTSVSNTSASQSDVRTYSSFEAVRSDSAHVYGRYVPRLDGRSYLFRKIVFPNSGMDVAVMDDIKSVSTMYLPPAHPERTGRLRPDPSKDCASSPAWRFEGRETYLNTPVAVFQAKDKSGSVLQWRAPSLDCAEVKSVHEITDPATGVMKSRSERAAISIQLGEPPAELFDVPKWQERGPISAEEEYFRKFKDGVVEPALSTKLEMLEKRYQERRRPQ